MAAPLVFGGLLGVVVATKKNPLMIDGKDWNREKVMEHICDQLATSSRGLGNILKAGADGHALPSYSTVMKWLSEDSSLSEMYARAKEAQADFMVDEILDVADDGTNDWMESGGDDAPGYRLNGEHIQRSKLRVDARKWVAAKLKPRKYGERVEQNVNLTDMTHEQWLESLK